MTKMEGIAAEVSHKLKSAIKAKLTELGAYVDDELSNYVMVMVTNRRSKADMDRELQLFLGANTLAFTSWLQSVWQKLEQVTVTNSGIDSKRRISDKKKKKKSTKSSSDTEDEKKHKKKRKSSISDSVSKDVKKRKLQPKELDSSKSDNKKKDDDSNALPEIHSDSDEKNERNKKSSKDAGASSGNEEEDFLNIKEDFESEFLSDNEYSESTTKSKPSSIVETKKSLKSETDTASKMITLKRNKDSVTKTADTKGSVEKARTSTDDNPFKSCTSIFNKETKPLGSRKPLVRDYKARSPLTLKSRRHSPLSPSKSRSRSKSPPQSKIIQLKRRLSGSASCEDADEDFNIKIQRSRLKSVTASGGSATVSAKSRSRSRSPLTSAITKKMQNQKSSSDVLDARELINRKRAMCMVNDPVMKEKNELGIAKTTISGGKIIRIRDRERSKENCLIEEEDSVVVDNDWPANGDQADQNRKTEIKLDRNSSSKFVISRSDGKRSVVVQSSINTVSSPPTCRRVDLRGIKRTVYIGEDTTERDEDEVVDDDTETETIINHKDNNFDKKKKIMDRVSKYIKPDKTVASTVVKLPKPPRPKTSPAQSASSTLIRKAMADAHKSLTNSKDDASKKKEIVDGKIGRDRFRDKNTIQSKAPDDGDKQNQNEIENENDDRISIKSTISSNDNMEDNYDEDKNMDEEVNSVDATEEYEPSISMPQFVVTLTGLDSKLFPKNDNDDLMDTLNDDLELDITDIDEMNKTKPKPQERCKYFPNCLAGDQCLYYHPTIPCKLFPNCKFGNNCLYVHPKCKFDSMCTRYDCTFMHTAPRVAPPVPPRHAPAPAMMNAQPCKFYYNCVNPVCPFQHPKICRFDRFCTNKNCTFSHTSLTHVSMVSKDKLKWSRPKDTDLKMESENEIGVQ